MSSNIPHTSTKVSNGFDLMDQGNVGLILMEGIMQNSEATQGIMGAVATTESNVTEGSMNQANALNNQLTQLASNVSSITGTDPTSQKDLTQAQVAYNCAQTIGQNVSSKFAAVNTTDSNALSNANSNVQSDMTMPQPIFDMMSALNNMVMAWK